MRFPTRRQFLQHATLASSCVAASHATGATSFGAEQTAAAVPAAAWRQPIAVSTYSFWRFQEGDRLPIEKCIELASAMGFDALEVLHIQMYQTDNAHL